MTPLIGTLSALSVNSYGFRGGGRILISSQPPPNPVYGEGSTQTLSVTAQIDTGSILYQWQKKESGSSTWTSIPGATSSTYSIGPLSYANDDGDSYRCLLTPSDDPTNVIIAGNLTIDLDRVITIGTQVTNQPTVSGETSTFSVSASVTSGTISYQWQRKAIGSSTWENIVGATSSSYTTGDFNYTYRCILSSQDATPVITSEVSLTPSFYTEAFIELWGNKGGDWTVGPNEGGLSAGSASRLGGKGGYTKIKLRMPAHYNLQIRPSYQGSTGGGNGGGPSGASAALLVNDNWMAVVGGGGGAGGNYIYVIASPFNGFSQSQFLSNNASPGGAGDGGYSASADPSPGVSGLSCSGYNTTSGYATGTVSGSGGGGAAGGSSGGTCCCDSSGQSAGGPSSGGSGGSGNIRIYRERQILTGTLTSDPKITMEYVTHSSGTSSSGLVRVSNPTNSSRYIDYSSNTDVTFETIHNQILS